VPGSLPSQEQASGFASPRQAPFGAEPEVGAWAQGMQAPPFMSQSQAPFGSSMPSQAPCPSSPRQAMPFGSAPCLAQGVSSPRQAMPFASQGQVPFGGSPGMASQATPFASGQLSQAAPFGSSPCMPSQGPCPSSPRGQQAPNWSSGGHFQEPTPFEAGFPSMTPSSVGSMQQWPTEQVLPQSAQQLAERAASALPSPMPTGQVGPQA
ncbi:unnamed protein product, partial [Effrenium voratum]